MALTDRLARLAAVAARLGRRLFESDPQTPLVDTLQRFGTGLSYVYLLRVPLLTWAGLLALPFLALPRDAVLGTMLRGLFDIGAPHADLQFIPFALLTLVALMAAATVTTTARLVLLDGEARFSTGPAPAARAPGVLVALRLLAAVVPVALVIGALVQSGGYVGLGNVVFGVALGVGGFAWLMQVGQNRIGAALRRRGERSWIFELVRRCVRLTPAGYVDATGRIRTRHAFALAQFLTSLGLYAAIFVVKLKWLGLDAALQRWALRHGWDVQLQVPTLCLVLVLVMLACWTLSGLAFTLDRFRVPLLSLLFVYGTAISVFPQGDHFFPSVARVARAGPPPAVEVLGARSARPAIVIATAGGGIQAAAWTARVIQGLHRDAIACSDTHIPDDFDRALVAISSVSGGSVGAMYAVDAYRNGVMDDDALDAAVRSAEASSLDDIAWGLTYPDLAWTLFPFLKSLNPRWLVKDRGTALDDALRRSPTLEAATLEAWRTDLRDHTRPAVLFNATVAETGQRMLFATTTLGPNDAGRREFVQDFERSDVPVTTAARLSATFPYVLPPARIRRYGAFDNQYHYVDGGYFDNYGTATLVEWLNQGLSRLGERMPQRVLLLRIRSSADDGVALPNGQRGWIFETAQPLATLAAVREAGQRAHGDLHVNLLQDDYGWDLIHVITITFPKRLAGERDDEAPPLSWHLTPADRGHLQRAWHEPEIFQNRLDVQRFLDHDNPQGYAKRCIQP